MSSTVPPVEPLAAPAAPDSLEARLAAAEEKIRQLLPDARRYRHLRANYYRYRYPLNEFFADNSMQLQFHVGGIWADAADPRVLDNCIDQDMKRERFKPQQDD